MVLTDPITSFSSVSAVNINLIKQKIQIQLSGDRY